MRRCFPVLFLIIVLGVPLCAESRNATLSGFVRDSASGESLIGALIYLQEADKGTVTNNYGFYSITAAPGRYTLVVSYLGYRSSSEIILLENNLRKDIQLSISGVESEEITITGERKVNVTREVQSGKMELEMEKIKSLPALLGEVDILKTIQLLPGVQDAGEGNSGFYVRGGGPDQNLVLLDEAVVYNASHLLGFFSVFNPDAVSNMTLIKGGMPARYGGRIASVLDISMKDGNDKQFKVSGGLSYIASRVTVEGPVVKEKVSFIVSARRTFVDLFLRKPFIPEDSPFSGNSYYFYDLNAKINYRISDRDRIFLSGYVGRDVFNFKSSETGLKVRIPWGNATASMRWNHLFNDRLFMNTSVIATSYNFEFGASQTQFDFRLFSGIRDYTLKSDYSWFLNGAHKINFGAEYIRQRFTPSNVSARSGDVEFDLGEVTRYHAHNSAVYLSDEWDVSGKVKLSAGLRGTWFIHSGPFNRYVQDPSFPDRIIDTKEYRRNETVKNYFNYEPRLSFLYSINQRSSIKTSYTCNYQYLHLASYGSVSLPTDTWMPSTDKIRPVKGIQYTAGYFRNFKNDLFETSIELYYKTMDNLIDYREGVTPDQDIRNNPDNNFVFGSGESYGAEFFIRKQRGKLNGWIGYTLAWTNRTFPDLNRGETFPAKYDRRHDASLVVIWNKTAKWTFGLTWVYATGDALTLPAEKFIMSVAPPFETDGSSTVNITNNPGIFSQYNKRNDFRQRAYHRMDLSATLHVKPKGKWQSEWVFSVYNAYSRLNPYFIYFDVQGNAQTGNIKVQAKQVSLFGIIPAVTFNFRF